MPETSDPDSSGRAGVAAVLLAAGESTRMDQPKALLEWAGQPLVQYQVQELQGTSAGEIVVVLGHRAHELQPLVEAVLDPPRTHIFTNVDYRQGKTTSIKAGLRHLRGACASVMLLAVDQPRPREVLQRLMDTDLGPGRLIAVPCFRGKHGHPPLFHARLLPELLAITEERQGMREVLQRHRDSLREVAFDSPLVLTNINTLEDYRRARELAGAPGDDAPSHRDPQRPV
ncbi:MAG: nucleotidyltransferase family protein [Dehalococcoidia bacterium]